jgi:hypothetical protein
VLSAIDNAETPDAVAVQPRASTEIAGAVAGLGATEVARRELSNEQIRDLVRSEIDERRSGRLHHGRPRRAGGRASR